MNRIRVHLLAASATALLSLSALAADMSSGMSSGMSPGMARDGVLTDAKGMTLYTFDQDPAGGGKSACNGPCATNWPPLMAAEGDKASGDWSIVTRDDGTRQWAYKGKPLYRWIKDQKPGDRSGDGMKEVWHAAKP